MTSAPPTILEVVVRFHPATGGVETTVLELSRGLRQRGLDVRVLCAANPAGPSSVEGIPVERLPYRLSLGGTHLARGIVAAAVRTRPQLIHAHLPTAWWADAAAAAARKLRVPLVLTYNNDICGPGLKGAVATLYNRLALPRLLRSSSAVVVPNPRYAASSPPLRRSGITPIVIPWGVNIQRFAPAPAPASFSATPLTVGFLSVLDRHHGYKGLSVLLRAAAAARADGVALQLRIAGAGEERARYEAMARELGLADAALFLGFVAAADLPAFFTSNDLFALPSTDAAQEGFGLVLLEAMASGRPVLTTPVVGMAAEIVAADAGMVVPPTDVDALRSALFAAASDRQRLLRMGDNARRLAVERFSWDVPVAAYRALFVRLLDLSGDSSK